MPESLVLIFLLTELQNATTKGGEEMLLNLKTEIARKRLSAAKIAEYIGITPKTMSCKVNEKTEFTRSEMFAIHSRFFPDADMRYLFYSENDKMKESKSL